ncbi:unnamed protein product [Amoebophrya sp. A25]|nr:unnamed protein product [Amoebophrya sp. A25]|eukprot:GSA25T00015424001.1
MSSKMSSSKPSSLPDCGPEIKRQVEIFRDEHKIRGEIFRARAYMKVLSGLQQLEGEGTSIRTPDDLKKIAGLSQTGKIKDKLLQIMENVGKKATKNAGGVVGGKESLKTVKTAIKAEEDEFVAELDSQLMSEIAMEQAGSKKGKTSVGMIVNMKSEKNVAADSLTSATRKRAGSASSTNSAGSKSSLVAEEEEDLDLPQVKRYKADPECALLRSLQSVHGLGPKRALTLIRQHNVRSLADAIKMAQEQADASPPKGKVATTTSKAFVFTRAERIGLQYCEEIGTKIPVKETRKHVDLVYQTAKKNTVTRMKIALANAGVGSGGDIDLKIEATGSFRRGAQQNGDIDFILSFNKSSAKWFACFLRALEDAGYLKETLASSVSFSASTGADPFKEAAAAQKGYSSEKQEHDIVLKWMGLCKFPTGTGLHRRVDFLCVSRDVYPFALLHFTGDALFNIELRRRALAQGYSLSEHGIKTQLKKPTSRGKTSVSKDADFVGTPLLKPGDSAVRTKLRGKEYFETEEDVLNFFGVKYIQPEKRKTGALEKHLQKK